jgi:endonuclease/exonuclease/phosphatase family metal-dependent hydrolase
MKVLTYNIQDGGDRRLVAIADTIRRQDPDVVAIMEASVVPNVEYIAALLDLELILGEANNSSHVAWLSRLPVLRSKNHCLEVLSKTLLEVEVAWGGDRLCLFATHLASHHDEEQHPQLIELQAILGISRSLEKQPHLLVGDFNALCPGDLVGSSPVEARTSREIILGMPRDTIQSVLDAGYVDCYRKLNPATPGFTYPSPAPWRRIDYIFASATMARRLRRCDVVTGTTPEDASDHLPLWAEFSDNEAQLK